MRASTYEDVPEQSSDLCARSEREEHDERVRRCHRDLIRAFENDRFILETEHGSVRQEDIDWTIGIETPTEHVWCNGEPQTVQGPPFLTFEFGFEGEAAWPASDDLQAYDCEAIMYGDQHVWRLFKQQACDVWYEAEPDDVFSASHEHEWADVEEVGWR